MSTRIDNLRVTVESLGNQVIEVPFRTPVHLPFGTVDSRPSLLVDAVVTCDGMSARGVAEGASLPMQIPMYDDFSGNLSLNATRTSEHLIGTTRTLREIQQCISSVALGGTFATARMTVETGIIDAVARSRETSVYSLLTGNTHSAEIAVPYGKSITEINPALMRAACREAVDSGARRLKFKISPDSFTAVYPTLRQLMHEYPDHSFMVDANGMFDVTNVAHLEMLRQLDELNMLTIEEPVSRAGQTRGLDAHRLLRDSYVFNTPITIDDAVKTEQDATTALTEDLAAIVNLKPGRVGSFLRCVDIAHNAARLHKQIMVGGMFEATPGRYMTTTLAAYCMTLGFTIPGDLSLPDERLVSDLGTDRLSLDFDGNIKFNPQQGWGYELREL